MMDAPGVNEPDQANPSPAHDPTAEAVAGIGIF
jgi:hypothetical protein